MKIYDYSHIEKLYLFGDIHGKFEKLFHHIKVNVSVQDELFKDIEHPLEKVLEEMRKNEESEDDTEADDDFDSEKRGAFNGMSSEITNSKKVNDKYDDSVIIICGDCGFGFCKPQYYTDLLDKANTMLGKTNTTVLFLRGNHDDPSYFDGKRVDYEFVKAIPDYSVVKTKNFNTLCVGGAVSADRTWRKSQEILINRYRKDNKKKLYWEGEEFVYSTKQMNEIKESGVKVDSIATHSAPDFAFPSRKEFTMSWFEVDKTLQKEMENERKNLSKLSNYIFNHDGEVKFWGYGHFHRHNSEFKTVKKHEIFLLALDDEIVSFSPFQIMNYLKEQRRRREEYEREQKEKAKVKTVVLPPINADDIQGNVAANVVERVNVENNPRIHVANFQIEDDPQEIVLPQGYDLPNVQVQVVHDAEGAAIGHF
jgi:hypothetical protein